ncbi:hypothetical protein N9I83_01470 [bacterium]|nr:hypothetical protein [bacterium]
MKISEVVQQNKIVAEAGWLQSAGDVYRTITGGQFFDKVKATLGANFGNQKARLEYNNIVMSGALAQSFLANTSAGGNKNPSSEDLAQFLIDADINPDAIQMAFQKVTPGKAPDPDSGSSANSMDPDVDYDKPAYQRKLDKEAQAQGDEIIKNIDKPNPKVQGNQGILDADGKLIQPESVIYEENKVLNKKEILAIIKQAVSNATAKGRFLNISIPQSARNPQLSAKQLVQAVANDQKQNDSGATGTGDAEVYQAVKDIKSMSPEQRAQLTKELQA